MVHGALGLGLGLGGMGYALAWFFVSDRLKLFAYSLLIPQRHR